jgi:hypothetical protein
MKPRIGPDDARRAPGYDGNADYYERDEYLGKTPRINEPFIILGEPGTYTGRKVYMSEYHYQMSLPQPFPRAVPVKVKPESPVITYIFVALIFLILLGLVYGTYLS